MRWRCKPRWGWVHVISLLIALALHGVLLSVVWNLSRRPVPHEAVLTVFVRLAEPVSSPHQPRMTPRDSLLAPVLALKSKRPDALAASLFRRVTALPEKSTTQVQAMPGVSQAFLAPAPDIRTTESATPVLGSGGAVQVPSELSLFCPVRTAPVYPLLARRWGEEGTVILQVEWDEKGQIISAQVDTSSGSRSLDAAALMAINNWRCNPAQHEGLPVRAMALQSFKFRLEEQHP